MNPYRVAAELRGARWGATWKARLYVRAKRITIPSDAPVVRRLSAVLAGASAAMLFTCAVGCPAPMTPQEKAQAADALYLAEHMKCVEEASTLAESKACRAEVRRRWGVDAGASR